jgi:arylsulfatase A-like enzyme
MVGKWHLGTRQAFLPQARGFNEFYGFLGGAHSYTNLNKSDRAPIYRGSTPIDEHEYLTDAFAREACAFIDRDHDRPFFLYLTFNAIHAPLQAPPKYLDRFSHITNPRRRTMCAMLCAMDDAVGRLLQQLRQDRIEGDTLIFFISDNGGPTPATTSRNDPLRGTKGTLWEGGIRVPFLVQWQGHIPARRTVDAPVSSLDIFTTSLTAAGVQAPQDHLIDGVNLLPYLEHKEHGSLHDVLYWRFGNQWAIRAGDYKLLKLPAQEPMLFDLSADSGEKHDLAAQNPKRVADLRQRYDDWSSQLQAPRWNRTVRQDSATRPARRIRQRSPASRPAG